MLKDARPCSLLPSTRQWYVNLPKPDGSISYMYMCLCACIGIYMYVFLTHSGLPAHFVEVLRSGRSGFRQRRSHDHRCGDASVQTVPQNYRSVLFPCASTCRGFPALIYCINCLNRLQKRSPRSTAESSSTNQTPPSHQPEVTRHNTT